jgi:subtilisin family serine protease
MFYHLWDDYASQAGGTWPAEANSLIAVGQPVPPLLAVVAPGLYQCVLSRATVHDMVEQDRRSALQASQPTVIFRVWPDYTLYPHIDRSAATVKADAGWRSFDSRGHGIVWAVIDSGIDASHEHFAALELYKEACGVPLPDGGLTSQLHRDFSYMVNPDDPSGPAPAGGTPPPAGLVPGLTDEFGHGTHVSGIIAGCSPQGRKPRVAESEDPDGGYVPRAHVGVLSGMAPACELVSIKVTRRSSWGRWVTSSSAVIKALTYLRTEVNVDPDMLRVHGVNMSLGCGWDPSHYAAGQSPLCRAVNQLRGQPGDRGRRGRGSPGGGHGVRQRAGACPGLHRGRFHAPGRAARLRYHLDLRQGPDSGWQDQA